MYMLCVYRVFENFYAFSNDVLCTSVENILRISKQQLTQCITTTLCMATLCILRFVEIHSMFFTEK